MTTLPEPPKSALVDPSTGALTREWLRFFDDLRRAIVSSLDDTIAVRLDALEGETLFGGADGTQGATAFSDAELRARLDLLELDNAFLRTSGDGDTAAVEALSAQITIVQSDILAHALELTCLPDSTAAVILLRKRVRDVEMVQAIDQPDTGAVVRGLMRRIQFLETLAVFDD
jgi:hypothetical protein